jgi:hypothetical protein
MTSAAGRQHGAVLVEFAPTAGLQQVALSPADLVERSSEALDNAMAAIQQMAGRISGAIEGLAQRPSGVEVTFGLKLTASADVLIVKGGGEASLNVKMTWQIAEPAHGH